MPSGYTAIFEEREPSFEEFVWKCARAMGAFIHMRDDSLDAPIRLPKENEFCSYHEDSLKRSVSNLEKYSKMSLEQAQILMNKDYDKMVADAKESIAKKDILRKRYKNVLAKVNAWNPPTKDHDNFKKFMTDQITQSIDWDCDTSYWTEKLLAPRQTAKEWLSDMITQAQHDIEYHTKHLAEDKVRNKERSDWISALVESVPMPK